MGVASKNLIKEYEKVCNDLIVMFCDKQSLSFDGWVGDEVGGISSFCCQYFFNMNDIILDLKTKQKVGLILEWQNDSVEAHFKNHLIISYKSYIKGERYDKV
jgi:hypothetical protein